MVIDHGHQIFDGTLDGLRASQSAPRTLVVDLATSLPPIEIHGATVTKVDGPRQHLTFPTTTSAAPLLVPNSRQLPPRGPLGRRTHHRIVITQLYTPTPAAELPVVAGGDGQDIGRIQGRGLLATWPEHPSDPSSSSVPTPSSISRWASAGPISSYVNQRSM